MQLIVVDPQSGRRKSVPLSSAVLRVGSAVDCDLVLPGNDVAAHALTVMWEGDHLVVEAVEDATFLHNEQKSRGAILHIGDVMRLGSYQIVVAPIAGAAPAAAAPPPAPEPVRQPPPPAAAPRPATRPAPVSSRAAAAFDDEAAEEGRGAAARRRPTKQHDGHFGLLFMVALAGGLGWGWYRGWFDRVLPPKYVSPRKPDPKEETAHDPLKEKSKEKETGKGESAGSAGAKKGESGSNDGASSAGHDAETGEAGEAAGEAAGGDDGNGSEASSSADVDATFAEVAKLLEAEEYSSCRWLLWQLHPKEPADLRRVAQRRMEVDVAAAKGGAAHLKLVDDLIKKGRLQTALNYCLEESIDRFRGTETWYALLDKADEIETIIDETVPEDRRLSTKRKHGRTRPADLATRAPPPVKVATLDAELVPIEKTANRRTPERGRDPERAGGEKGREPTAPNEPEKPAAPPSAEQLALREKMVAAVAALAAAKPAAVEAKLKSLAAVAEAAGPAAVAPLVERAAALGDLLDAAPEKAALAELRAKCQALKAAREAAFAFLDDSARYFMLDPKAPGDVSRGDELAAAQKEADKLVDAVRDEWGSELGGAPAPQVNLSDGYARLVQEAQAIDALLAAQKAELPAKTELLATRLLPSWSRKIHVRNYALDVVERDRLDRDRLVRTANQRVRDVDGDALEMLSTVNAYREMFGRAQLQWDGKLATSAQLLASLRTKEAKAYKESDPQPLPEPRQAAEGGVNLLRGHFSARQGLQAWTRMAGAHRNLIDAEHRSVGIGVDAKYWVVKFGKFVPGQR